MAVELRNLLGGTGRRVQSHGRIRPGPGSAFLALTCGALLCATGAATAQTASQITPPSFQPRPQPQTGGFVVPEGTGGEAPAGAETLKLRIGRVVVDGGFPQLAEDTSALLAGLERRTVSVAEIFAAARALEQAYARAGYVLVRVVLPAQRLDPGRDVSILVVDGTFERVDASAVPEAVRGRVEALLAPLVGVKGLTLGEIERRLVLAAETPGTVLRSTLSPGSPRGAGVLVIEARHQLVTGSLTWDNTPSQSLGRSTAGAALEINSALGFGEQVYVRLNGWPGGGDAQPFGARPRSRALAGGVTLPLGADGVTLNLEASKTVADPIKQAGAAAFGSDFSRYSARLRDPIVRGRAANLTAELSFDAQEELLATLPPTAATISHDVLRIARGALEGSVSAPWAGTLSGRLDLSLGIDGLGARKVPPAGAIPLSRQGARPDLQKLGLSARYDQPLLDHLTVQIDAKAQSAFGQALPRSEQIGLASPSGLSTYASGEFQGDGGYVVRGEVQSPWAMPTSVAAISVVPYVFAAVGEVSLNRPSGVEFRRVRGGSYGLGMRSGAAVPASQTSMSVAFEWGRESRSDLVRTSDRISIQSSVHF